MAKVTINTVTGGTYSADLLNANFTALANEFENVVSRDGTAPNSMSDDFDMNSNRIINLTDGVNAQDAATVAQLSATAAVVAGAGLIDSGTAIDVVGATDGALTVNADDMEVSLSGLTNVDVSTLGAADEILLSVGGTNRAMQVQDMGVRTVETSAIQTFALGDANSMQILTGSTDRVWTIPTNASVAFPIGVVIICAARDTAEITLDPNSGPTLTSTLASSTSTTQRVLAGGTAALVKVATDEWMVSGDIAL